VFLRRRIVAAKSVGFIRIPGEVPDAPVVAKARKVTSAAPVVAALKGEAKNEAPFTNPVPQQPLPAPELRSEHGGGDRV
jgi:hypothetical protein